MFSRIDTSTTGLVVPVSALRSRDSLGVGEFPDLLLLGEWAKEVGLTLIQILPVNDSGHEASPYNALSAFALHPLYARLKDFPEAEHFGNQLTALKAELDKVARLDYSRVLKEKFRLLRAMWASSTGAARREIEAWEAENEWVRTYALFRLIREENGQRSWTEWGKLRNPGTTDLARLWKKKEKEARFYVWVQMRLEQQFRGVAEQLDAMGLALKGDIPILINDDSADVWADRRNFNLTLRAGSPPDAGSPGGQNWGFPTYDWDYLKSDGFRWWRNRIAQASKFYHAYRIDHVLGFFRIWAIPETEISARCGHFEPSVFITRGDLVALGWKDDRITWLSRPHIAGDELRNIFGTEASLVTPMLEEVENEDLWRSRNDGPTEQDVRQSTLGTKSKEHLISLLQDKTLIQIEDDLWAPNWSYTETRGWKSLPESEKEKLNRLIVETASKSEALWEKNGRALLEMMRSDGSMLVCAEDLGAVPTCVPGVLEALGILGLKVFRWAKAWSHEGQPYIDPKEYPRLSVATSSVHDSTTLRGWLENEARDDEALRRVLEMEPSADLSGTGACRSILTALAGSSALLAIHPLQDFLALDTKCVDKNPALERINTPGTVHNTNWTWRMKVLVEDLRERRDLNDAVRALSQRPKVKGNS